MQEKKKKKKSENTEYADAHPKHTLKLCRIIPIWETIGSGMMMSSR